MMPDFLASECTKRGPEARFHVLPVPLEATVSYGGGTAGGPAAILAASQQLEDWDGHSCPLEAGIHTCAAVDCSGGVEAALARIERATAAILVQKRLPVLLGGEHSASLGALRALARLRGNRPFGLIQIDAHADLREAYEGTKFSHACIARRAVDDLGLPLFQFGCRAFSGAEAEFRKHHPAIHFLDAADFAAGGFPEQLLPPEFPDEVYLSFDVDGLDPAVIRATGTPVPGGPGWRACLSFVQRALAGRKVLGFDVMELAPQAGDRVSDFAAAQLVYALMGIVQRNEART